MNKTTILEKLGSGHQQMLEAIDGLSEEAMLQPGVVGDWSVKDILNHLSHWEAELVTLLWQVQQGQKPFVTSHSVEVIEKLNQQWYLEGFERSLEMVMADFRGVRKQTIRRVEALTDDDLTQPNRYLWLKGKSLADKIATYSFEHETEHMDSIREWRLQQSA
jgi:hypothetical protein